MNSLSHDHDWSRHSHILPIYSYASCSLVKRVKGSVSLRGTDRQVTGSGVITLHHTCIQQIEAQHNEIVLLICAKILTMNEDKEIVP